MMNAGSPGDRVRVLIVEDETLVWMMLSDIVEDAGFEAVGPALTADEALQLAQEDQPTIAIIDVTLGGGREGVEVGAELARRHAMGLIFISGHGGVGNWPEVRALRPVAVLQKPCLPAQVMEALTAAAKASGHRSSRPG